MKKILLIAIKHAPYTGVGANRWNKLSYHLAKRGYEIHILSANWPKNTCADSIPIDVSPGKIVVHKCPIFYPIRLFHKQARFPLLQKILTKLWELFVSPIFFWDDFTQLSRSFIIRKASKLIRKENISTVIATGHPFRANCFAAILKEQMPDIKLIQDFRDPWAQDEALKLSEKKRNICTRLQRFSINKADVCVAPTKGLADLMSEQSRHGQWAILPNGYYVSQDVLDSISCKKKDSNEKIKFTYIGNISDGRLELFSLLVSSLAPYKDKAEILYVGAQAPVIKRKFPADIQSGLITVYPLQSQSNAYKIVANSHWAVQLNSRYYPYLVSTKIYEYGKLKVPTLSLNYGGEIETLIQESSLGISINVEKTEVNLVIEEILNRARKESYRFDVESYSFENIAKNYDSLIAQL